MFKKLAAMCGLAALLAVSLLYASTALQDPPPDHRVPAELDIRIQRLVRYNQRLQQALAKATSTYPPAPTATLEAAVPGSTKFAYVFYATMDTYACGVLVNIARLRDLNSTLPIHVLVSPDVSVEYLNAMEDAGAKVHIETPPPLAEDDVPYYKDCLLKMLAFKMHTLEPQLERVLLLDSDQMIMKSMDDLFEGLPPVDLAAPRAYWLGKDVISSTFLMITLSDRLWQTVEAAVDAVGNDKFDMDLVNDLLGDTVLMLGGEYVTINSHFEDWNLPKWFHPGSDLNVTTVQLVNQLVKKLSESGEARRKLSRRESRESSSDGGVDKAMAHRIDPALNLSDEQHKVVSVQPIEPLLDHADGQHEVVDAQPTDPFDDRPDGRPKVVHPPAHPEPSPRFPLTHPISKELYRLRDQASVIHFFAVGKPWVYSATSVKQRKPDAHPLLADMMEEWRNIAVEACPGGILSP